ncbi:MAG: BrnT family toxin [Rhizobiales bacterium]|nr:BrnT family toxin [Hyphomicrobiales bacterium]
MIDLGRIVGFEWDDGNRRKSADKHDVSPAEAEQVFLNKPLLLLDDTEHSATEQRFHAYGKTHTGRLLQIAFTLRQDATMLRVISARPMSAKERARYGKET